MVTSTFFWARAGSKVYMEGEAEVLYVVNLLPCTITRVAAMKTVRGVPDWLPFRPVSTPSTRRTTTATR